MVSPVVPGEPLPVAALWLPPPPADDADVALLDDEFSLLLPQAASTSAAAAARAVRLTARVLFIDGPPREADRTPPNDPHRPLLESGATNFSIYLTSRPYELSQHLGTSTRQS